MATDKMFVFTSSDNTFLFIKSPNIQEARKMAGKTSTKNFNLYVEAEKWSFMDTSGVTEEQYSNMEVEKQNLDKWNKFKKAAENYIKTKQELNIDVLEFETDTIKTFVNTSVVDTINTHKNNLNAQRGSSIVFNGDTI